MTDIQQLMQMGQQLQAKMAELQEELSVREISASAGGGMVTATVDGKGGVTRRSYRLFGNSREPDRPLRMG